MSKQQFAVYYNIGRATAYVAPINLNDERWQSSLDGDYIDRFNTKEEAQKCADEYNDTDENRKYWNRVEIAGYPY